jgi:uncharacterized DUF497 family protein
MAEYEDGKFCWDDDKNNKNVEKHGISFYAARALWAGGAVEIPARSDKEERALIIGTIGETHWSAIITRRSGKIRIISVRRSRQEERDFYEETRSKEDDE